MSGIDLDIRNIAGKTVTEFVTRNKMKFYEPICFHNCDHAALLKVTIQGKLPVLVGVGAGTVINVEPRSSRCFEIEPAYANTNLYFKYTAEIVGAAVEDPIIIIEKS